MLESSKIRKEEKKKSGRKIRSVHPKPRPRQKTEWVFVLSVALFFFISLFSSGSVRALLPPFPHPLQLVSARRVRPSAAERHTLRIKGQQA